MKRLVKILALAAALVFVGAVSFTGRPAQASSASQITALTPSPVLAVERRNLVDEKARKVGYKIDLNNSNIRAFIPLRGMYPTLAGMIVRYSPFESVDEVFDMPGLSDRQKEILENHRDEFVVTRPEAAFVEGADRFNNGIYK
ncbi:MAG: photosystem II complex extrinsic protein PsbU [Elainellaceae cyanobacterium]